MTSEIIVAIISSGGLVFLAQNAFKLIRRARAGHLSWVRREVDKATRAQREAESKVKALLQELADERQRRLGAEMAVDALREQRDAAFDERDAEAREKRIAWEEMHKHRLILLRVAPDQLPALTIDSTP